ncbi:flagellar biosynthesis protein FlgL [Oleiphilus sp. HI0009]|uniref:flagellar hook-associated protein FlgL n=2 Tax=Oleiphilus TaxID=141450 RepID=UPI0007C3C1F8|nr:MULTISPECIES: flagellar hook-associated protein FlgL [unclassified Oleiphilus]KZX82361.1 flagellar biosynthesis protein FlgL [Oleiphilus sp. HI0009]KZY64313.1 flagellar biosynthesis protein FlgL [Oleiphilus sp. HI0066]KZY66973.1 flagellar biosynthesis protein FlgL [Oleiphilus sp. HI0067]MCH2159748.1 flagellar hook-associated protein FlgL [Oleiphilaceae bacterium]
MRISTVQIYDRAMSSIQDVTAQQQKTQQQLASGKRVLTPADDPVASTRILELKQELSVNQQFQRNVELAEGRLSLQDDRLGGINEVIERLRTLAVSAGNGALTKDDLGSIAAEVESRLDQLAGLLNARDASGEYVFSGFQGGTQPFQQDDSGSYRYHGDEGVRYVQIDASVTIQSTINGQAIFEDMPTYTNSFFTRASEGNQAEPPATITVGQVVDQADYDAFYPEDLVIEFTSPNTFDLREKSTGVTLQSNVAYAPNGTINAQGTQFEIRGAPATGDTFTVESTEKQGLLTTVEKFVYGLRNFAPTTDGREAFESLLEGTIANFDFAATSVLEARGQLGARLNTLDTGLEQLKDAEILTQEVLGNLESIDYAETVSLLSLQQFSLDAAYSSFNRITSLSLFDRIR